MNIRHLNINQLVLLDTLLETRNVTATGQRLGLSQPATSAALSKLRILFKDQLLVLVGRELQLTPKAESLREPIHNLLDYMEEIFREDDFSPAQLSGEFVIATADYMPILMGPHLLENISELAPDLTLRFTNINRESVHNLKSGEIQMIIAPDSLINDPTLISQNIFRDRLVCVYQKGTRDKKKISIEEYMASKHIATTIDGIESLPKQSTFVKEIDDLRASQKNHFIVPYYAALPFISANSELLGLVQERLVQKMINYMPLEYTDPPIDLPPLKYAMFWSPRVNHEASNRWIRKAIFEMCKKNFPDNPASGAD